MSQINPSFEVNSSDEQLPIRTSDEEDRLSIMDEKHRRLSKKYSISNTSRITDFSDTLSDDYSLVGERADVTNNQTSLAGLKALCHVGKRMVNIPILRTVFIKSLRLDEYPDFVSNEKQAVESMRIAIDKFVTSSHPGFKLCHDLLSDYEKTGKVEHVLRLYTLETPFFQWVTTDDTHSMLAPVYFNLDRLKTRHFQGVSYRGLQLTEKDLSLYESALRNDGSILSVTKFSSTSTDKKVASKFIDRNQNDRIPVLMEMHFPKTCDTVIRLFAETKDEDSISFYDNEKEVLVCPLTFFRVLTIVWHAEEEYLCIQLENVRTKGGFFALFKAEISLHT